MIRELFKIFFFYISIITVLGCVKTSTDSDDSKAQRCQKAKVAGQFIVHWKEKSPSLVNRAQLSEILKTERQNVKMVEPNYYISTALYTPQLNDESAGVRPPQFFHDQIHTRSAWNSGFYGQGITIAVVDTGIATDHPLLRFHLKINDIEYTRGANGIDDDGDGVPDDVIGWNFVSNSSIQNDESGHGTAIAGIIVGGDNTLSLGMAPRSQIIPIDFMNETGGTEFHAQQAISYALARHANIINNSWSTNCSELLKSSFSSWKGENVVFVNAAGNSPVDVSENEITPSSVVAPNVINVGSVDESGHRSSFSGFGQTVTLFAPGELIPVLFPESGLDLIKSTSGTSFSAAIVSGAAALLWSAFPEATGPEIIKLIQDGANQELAKTKILDIQRSMILGHKRFRH